LVLVNDTYRASRNFPAADAYRIVAMSMEKLLVTTYTAPVWLFVNDVDHLYNISVFEEQFANRASTPLPFQESGDP
jgi:hypothetical protein